MKLVQFKYSLNLIIILLSLTSSKQTATEIQFYITYSEFLNNRSTHSFRSQICKRKMKLGMLFMLHVDNFQLEYIPISI